MLESTDSQLWLGIVTGIGGLTMFAFSPLAGVAVDPSNRRNLLVNVRIALMSVFLVAAALGMSGVVEPWQFTILGLAIGAVSAFAGPAYRALVAGIVGSDGC